MATPESAGCTVSRWARRAADDGAISTVYRRTAPGAGTVGAQRDLGSYRARGGGCTQLHDLVADFRFRQGVRRHPAVAHLSAPLCDHRQPRLRFSNPGNDRRRAEPEQFQLRLRVRVQLSLSRMLCEGRGASWPVQSIDPAGRGRLYDADQPGAGKSDHRHDPARDHLGGAVFPDRCRGDHTGKPRHRARLWRRGPAPLLSRRHLPAQHRPADFGVVMQKIILTLAAAVAIGAAPAVRAHAFLDYASPAVGSSVPAAPVAVTLWFT